MSTTLIIAARELRERSRLFIVAGALAVIPFLLLLAPGSRPNHDAAIRAIGGTAAIIYALALALAMGVSVIGRDLSEKRLSFYFVKPVSATALWVGKAGASLAVAFVCAIIVAAPSTLLTSPSNSAWVPPTSSVVALTVLGVVAFFFGSHALSTVTRSRSILVLLDSILLVAALAIVAAVVRPLILGGGNVAAGWMATGVTMGLLALLAFAPLWQLSRGRTDARRSHAAFSQFLWVGFAVVLAMAAISSAWFRSVSLDELVEVRDIQQAPRGGWAFVTGHAPHRDTFQSSFLVNAKTGESQRLGVPLWSGVRWSDDGSVAVWMRPVGLFRVREFELVARDMRSNETRSTGITGPAWVGMTLSADGARVAIARSQVIQVHDLKSGRMLASVALANGSRARLFFVTPDLVRVVTTENGGRMNDIVRVHEVHVPHRSIVKTAERTIPRGVRSITFSADGSLAFVRTTGEIVDGRTLVPIVQSTPAVGNGSAMLRDGRVAVVEEGRVRFFDREGHLARSVALPKTTFPYLLSEGSDGRLLLMAGSRSDRNMLVIDPGATTARMLRGTSGALSGWDDPRIPRYEAGVPLVGTDASGKIRIWTAG